MTDLKDRLSKINKGSLQIAGVILLVVLAALLLWFNHLNDSQASAAIMAQVRFEGEYRVGDGEWQTIAEGQHIPATKGDVTLRGNFHMFAPDGEYVGLYNGDMPIAFYLNHINLTFYEEGIEPIVFDIENPMYGNSACCVYWDAYQFAVGSDAPIEILVHNPHKFGNENAIDELLSNVSLWSGIDFERGIMESGQTQRNIGLLFVVVSLVLLGSALFSTLLHVPNNRIILLLGVTVLSAGIYLAYSAPGVSFWSESRAMNTSVLGFSMMFYMLFITGISTCFLKETKPIGYVVNGVLVLVNGVYLLLPVLAGMRFYDTWLLWVFTQSAANAVLLWCIVKDFCASDKKQKEHWALVGMALLVIAFEVDAAATAFGSWQGGFISKYVFFGLFVAALFVVLRLVPESINALTKARELETEKLVLNAKLAESRISTMMSQIRPHFIYNTLGSIEQLCKLDPPKAGELVHNFAKYLRGNFRELDNPKPILMSQEMEHVHHYVRIENVRFPDMTFSFEMNSNDFYIPALTIQPLVENAIKHGLMKLEKGGTIRVVSFETESHYCVSVADNGVGFDTSVLLDERAHIGIRNIRGRLRAMVNGTLEIESTEGVGTKVLIKIPKEVQG